MSDFYGPAKAMPPELTRTAGYMIEHFDVKEFFLEYRDRDTGKGFGIKVIPAAEVEPTRIIGAYGTEEFNIAHAFELQRGHKMVLIKASPEKPARVITYLYPML